MGANTVERNRVAIGPLHPAPPCRLTTAGCVAVRNVLKASEPGAAPLGPTPIARSFIMGTNRLRSTGQCRRFRESSQQLKRRQWLLRSGELQPR